MTTKQNEIHICRSFAYLFIICIRERLVSDQGILRTLLKECYATFYLSTYCTFNEYVVPRNRRLFAFSYKIQVSTKNKWFEQVKRCSFLIESYFVMAKWPIFFYLNHLNIYEYFWITFCILYAAFLMFIFFLSHRT